nr:Chain C, LF20 [synthetic construct]1PWV_D Chain D, LF20 [synthetic construct]1PWW_C Chain C, LF20 [synthetic construct]1PWW_D Chain D, LF20 [synthetic construct]
MLARRKKVYPYPMEPTIAEG